MINSNPDISLSEEPDDEAIEVIIGKIESPNMAPIINPAPTFKNDLILFFITNLN